MGYLFTGGPPSRGGYAEPGLVADAPATLEEMLPAQVPRLPAFADARLVLPSGVHPIDTGMFRKIRSDHLANSQGCP